MRDLSVSPTIDPKSIKEAKASTSDTSINAAVQRNEEVDGIRLEEYSEKSFVVRGNTKKFKDALSAKGGKWMKTREGTSAWMFSKRHLKAVAEIVGVAAVLS